MAICEKLLAAGVPINKQDSNGMSSLHLAAAEGEAAVVASLLKNGADKSLKNVCTH